MASAFHPKNILAKAWIGVSTTGTVTSIASLLGDIIAWRPFAREIIAAYRSIVDFVWTPLLGLLPFHAPRWLHDYFTVTSLMTVSVLWALHSTSRTFGWGGLGSVFGVIVNSIFDLRIGGNLFELFAKHARENLAKLPGGPQPEAQQIADELAAMPKSAAPLIDGVATTAAILVAGAALPIAIAPLVQASDNRADRRTFKVIRQRREVLEASALQPAEKSILRTELQSIEEITSGRVEMTGLYHAHIRKQMLYYYAAVFLLFAIVVFVNYAVSWLAHAPPDPPTRQ
jgi:hypothetical protein